MKVSREVSIVIKYFLDECLPPIIRDSPLYHLVHKVAYGNKSWYFENFRNKFYKMNYQEISQWYGAVVKYNVHYKTDLSQVSIQPIITSVVGKKVLDIACGLGYLATVLGDQGYQVTAADFVIADDVLKHKNVKYKKANIEKLPFKDKQFDTVISCHTLEHTLDVNKSVSELRRVCKKKLVIIIPREHPYKFGCNFHTHYFPYEYSVYQLFSYKPKKQTLKMVGVDWLYTEKLT